MTTLLVIDPQISFMDMPGSELKVKGATADMDRLTDFIKTNGHKIDAIRVTLDSHHPIHIAHAIYWVDKDGNHPDDVVTVLTGGRDFGEAVISLDKVEGPDPQWKTTNPAWRQHGIDYVKGLGLHPLTIWPQHCLIGSNGAKVYEPLHAALVEWEMSEFASVDWVTKGSNFHTEHYGAIKAEVPMPDDDTTQTNTEFAEVMQNSDNVLVAGEASSHCVSRTLTQIAEEFGDDYVRKITLIEDGTSAVEGCEFLYDTFVKEMTTPERGMKIKKFADIF